jgi:hypothetical protein
MEPVDFDDQQETLSEHVPIRFPAGLIAAAKQMAAAEGMTVSAWIRREVEREATRRERPAPELPAVEAKLRETAADNIGLRAQLAAVSALSAEMHAEADASGDDRVAAVLHEYASRIRLALGPEALEQP